MRHQLSSGLPGCPSLEVATNGPRRSRHDLGGIILAVFSAGRWVRWFAIRYEYQVPSNPTSIEHVHVCVMCVCADRVAGRKGCDSIGGCPSLGGDRRVERSGVVDYLIIVLPRLFRPYSSASNSSFSDRQAVGGAYSSTR